MRINIKNATEYSLIMLVILLSGTLYFNSTILTYLLVGNVLFYVIISRKLLVIKNNFNILLILFILFGIQYGFTYKYGVSLNELKKPIIIILVAFLIQNNMQKYDFCKYYLNLIVVISIISLICFTLVNILGIHQLPFQKTILTGISEYQITPYYNLGIDNYHTLDGYIINNELGFSRNCGIFWEPGAYQAYLNIALLILSNKYIKASSEQLFLKSDLIKVLIIAFTLATTQSTTGYMIGICILIYTMLMVKGSMDKKYVLKLFLLILVLILIVILSPIKEVIIDKVIYQQGSYSTRSSDNVDSFLIFLDNPIWGYGFNSSVYAIKEAEQGIYHNSSGIGLLFAMFGGIFGTAYLIILFKGLKKFFNTKRLSTVFMFSMFLAFHFTEWLIFAPIFVMFLFAFKPVTVE